MGSQKIQKNIYKNRSNLTGHVLYGLQHIQTKNANFLKLNSSQAEKSFFFKLLVSQVSRWSK